MPIKEKKVGSDLLGAVDSFLDKKRRDKATDADQDEFNPEFLDILEFIEKFSLFPNGLFPVQRFILKLYYNLPLDDVLPDNPDKRIKVTKTFHKKNAIDLTEVQYLEHLHTEGRCNMKVQDGRERRELILVLGRRSGKSAMSAIITAYEIYKLLRRGTPQTYYGMPPGAEIRTFCIANDKEQAGIVYGDISSHVSQVDYFKSSVVHDTQTFLKFQTEGDRQRFKDPKKKKATITATFKSSIAKGLRGRGIICCILDELAFFVNDGKSSDKQVYRAIYPSLKQFSPKDPKNRHKPLGPSEGRMICISSPDAREGLFYDLYEMAKANDVASSNMLMIQAPTWEVNPTIDESEYVIDRAKNPTGFETEYGANFSDRVRGWIEDQRDLLDCCVEGLKPLLRGHPREPFFAGVDFAVSKDGTAISLTHLKDGKVELAYHETWQAGKPWKVLNPHLVAPVIPYAHLLQDQRILDIDEIANWFVALTKRFYIIRGLFDQFAGPIFQQKMHKVGLTQFEMHQLSTADSSSIYQSAKMLMYSRQLAVYDFPRPQVLADSDINKIRHSPHIQELLELQSTAAGKNLISVEAPKTAGKHDDFSDSFVRSCFLAAEYIRENPGVLEGSHRVVSSVPVGVNVGYNQYHRSRARMHGLPPKERRLPSMLRRGR